VRNNPQTHQQHASHQQRLPEISRPHHPNHIPPIGTDTGQNAGTHSPSPRHLRTRAVDLDPDPAHLPRQSAGTAGPARSPPGRKRRPGRYPYPSPLARSRSSRPSSRASSCRGGKTPPHTQAHHQKGQALEPRCRAGTPCNTPSRGLAAYPNETTTASRRCQAIAELRRSLNAP
jgi:hypothetical protein